MRKGQRMGVPPTARIDMLLTELTLEEKAALMTGRGIWDANPVERLGIPALKVTDGPNGARGAGILGTGAPVLCIPCGSALGATWDQDLVEELGAVLAAETRARACHVLLAPTVNIHRTPLGGRNFECYSEDPVLTGRTAAAFIRGVQGGGVGTTIKHFVANDSEFERNSIDSVVPDRALREVYLRPFEIAVSEAAPWGLMGSYNRVNGTFACENRWLLTEVLRDEWGFDGIVVTDWFAAKSTAVMAGSGLDLEMPGAGRFYGPALVAATARSTRRCWTKRPADCSPCSNGRGPSTIRLTGPRSNSTTRCTVRSPDGRVSDRWCSTAMTGCCRSTPNRSARWP